MALIEKDIADELVALRSAMALGHTYVDATDLDAALQRHLEREQWWRSELTRLCIVVSRGVDQ